MNKKRFWISGMGVALYYDLKYNRYVQVLKDFSFPGCLNMQVSCPFYVKDQLRTMLYWQMCGFISQIWAQWIDYKTIDQAFISYLLYCYFALNQNMVVQ